jgi:CheY-like chemotaxis protein
MTKKLESERSYDVLLVEDSASDAELTKKAFERQHGEVVRLHHVRDGVECMQFLRQEDGYSASPRPDLILLDLNMPRMDGREVLRHVKMDDSLATIPVVVLSTSSEESDILDAYQTHTNAYLVKPVDLKKFFGLVSDIQHFWFQVSELPPH